MDNTLYQSLIADLSESERSTFENLLARLESLNGNLENLSEEEQAQLASLASSHNFTSEEPAISSSPKDLDADESNFSAGVRSDDDNIKFSKISETERPTDTEFGAYLLENINESLCQGGASTADAIRYAFHNRWMPEKLKNRDICEELYYRFVDEIEDANKGIREQSPSNANNDTTVAVGLAWFTTLYQCYQVVETEGDI